MPIKKHFRAKIDKNNIFHDCDTLEELSTIYRNYVRKYGTSEYINEQFRKRRNEIDLQNAEDYGFKW